MNPSDPLAQLKDIHLPDGVSWWPLAPGWWMLSVICLVVVIAIVRFVLLSYFKRAYRRQALAQLRKLPQSNQHQRLVALFSLLKQVASSAYPKQNFASLSNQEFINFLQNSSRKTIFKTLPNNWEQLFYAKGQSVSAELVDQLVTQANQWIKRHLTAEKLGYQS